MICEVCGHKQATVHLTEIVDDQITELHLCEDCAREKGAQMEEHFGLADLLAGLADLDKQFAVGKEVELRCPNCGLSYPDFKKMGRLGCSECYTTFKKSLLPLLKRIHGSTQHVGKTPQKVTEVVKVKSEIQELKEKLQKAIQLEEFEEAARLRDKIRELEEQN
jgi:protein arginine kinase activator